jgi:trehalose-6-phosphatase
MAALDLTALFDYAMIPHHVTGLDDEPYHYSKTEIEEINTLAAELIAAIRAGEEVVFYFDCDGSSFRLTPDPKDVKMDRACYEGLVRLSQFPKVTAMALTGRDISEVRDRMLAPGYEVKDSAGTIIAGEGDKTLRFSVIGSHGVERIAPDGAIEQYDFGAETQTYIDKFKAECALLRDEFPGITIEGNKHGSVGINVATMTGDDEARRIAYNKALHILQHYEASDSNPDQPKNGNKVFQIRKEGHSELELRPVSFGKDFGIRRFGKTNPKALTLLVCDSLGYHGTDRPAAELINDRASFENGNVVLVRNGRNEPPAKDAPYRARVTFANPTLVGRFLCMVAEALEKDREPTCVMTSRAPGQR